MFAGTIARIERLARARARARGDALAGRLAQDLPADVRAAADPAGVQLTGRGLRRRLARDARLRAAIAGGLK